MKKKIPLVVLKSLEKFVTIKGEEFEVLEPKEYLLRVVDKDKNSDFYFNIKDFRIEKGLRFQIDYKPRDSQSIQNFELWIMDSELESFFDKWLRLLREYDTVKSFYDDPILRSFANDYYSEFEIIDENADTEPLKPAQIFLLDKHLEYLEKNIGKYEDDTNRLKIQEISEDINELRENLTSKSKAWVINGLSFIWAKITTQGINLMKDLLSETKKQAVIQGVKLLIGQSIELLK